MSTYWENKPVLVTGAGGFIGSHLVEQLVEKKAKVKAFIRYNSRNDRGALEWLSPLVQEKIEIIAGDLRNPDAVESAMRDVDTVFHLGALIAIPYSYRYPKDVIETNILGTTNILLSAKKLGTKRIIHASSSEVYGTAQYVPIDEQHPLQAQSPYAASKIGADKIVESFVKSYGLPITILRPFNTYGPRQSGRAVIPTIISQALTQTTIFLGAMNPKRDFTYIEDTIDAFFAVAESEKTIGEVYNAGSNFEISIGDLAEKIITLMDKKVDIIFDATRIRPATSEVGELMADSRKLMHATGWKPKTSLDDGLKKTIEWISEYITLYKANIYNI
ncbi:MAG: GDP-mannose 4,6-dehydratase [bacterium]|nr:GDP-mannose 4,6-dehydratase [bacterium]